MSDDSDNELLANLLACADDDEEQKTTSNFIEQIKSNPLKELDFNFLDDVSSNIEASKGITVEAINDCSSLLEDLNSSDDEDKKYFEKQHYSDYGREIKNLIKSKEADKESHGSIYKQENSLDHLSNNINSSTSSNSSLSHSFKTLSEKSDKHSLQAMTKLQCPVKADVYTDPVFGLRMIRPIISSSELIQKMENRKPVIVRNIKLHLANVSAGNINEDWVIAGVLINKSLSKTSQKGNQYIIWNISDLSMDMKSVAIFLFKSAYKQYWKVSVGTVVAILNPSVFESTESRRDTELAALSVNNSERIMLLGTSKDLGKCKSMKKNGEPCSTPVNLRICEHCVYHVKQEYGKFSRRSDIQTSGLQRTFAKTNTKPKSTSIYNQRNPEAAPFIAIPAKRNEALYKKDCERLALLRGESPKTIETVHQKVEPVKVKVECVPLTANQMKKDADRLNKLKEKGNTLVSSENKFNLPPPKLGNGMKGGIIDFSMPISKNLKHKAKLNAVEWVKQNGMITKTNPNKIRPSKEELTEKGIKRKRENEESESAAEAITKKELVKSKFQELLEMKSSHTDLIDNRESEETEKYFNKLEVKERMEEKMLSTFKVDCKAVRCSVCKYVAFSSSDFCKKLQHPIKVIDAVKRFFKCSECGNRTVSLDRIPTETCKRCSSSKWIKTAMMDEKRTEISKSNLCIRGGEEKFIGSTVSDASLNLLVPETD